MRIRASYLAAALALVFAANANATIVGSTYTFSTSEAGNTVIIIEHNLDVIKSADYIVDLGPEGGAAGGRIVATGTPEEVAGVEASSTGRFLADLLFGRSREPTRMQAG